ncbi:hypothetical protein [Mesorhizobium sp.]|uniref:hypothetical protein n=1 Tax=Mesorhizobium sp. TaxID=1871066 RepID=UPI000FE820F1|nr:hypothetical protein [Mesorhizobium sp.]RWP29843.1 MAG: hypothetical protein EOR03_25625 [Mesorhizobium sp.]TIL66022.1 MAG: hypothetical protein E5Y77_19960 [Mesorhizobium sp.]
MNNELELRELRDDELDLVSAGIHRLGHSSGLVTVIVRDIDVEVEDVNVSVNALSSGVVFQR